MGCSCFELDRCGSRDRLIRNSSSRLEGRYRTQHPRSEIVPNERCRAQANRVTIGAGSTALASGAFNPHFGSWERLRAHSVGVTMTKFLGEPSPEQIAKMNRQRLAAADGAQAMEDVAKKAADVRANMARLRALRLAKEAMT